LADTLTFEQAPAFGPIYRRVLFQRRPGLKGGAAIPELAAKWPGAKADQAAVQAYREACAFEADGRLPITYPHVLTSAMHLSLISHPEFPLSALGSVHSRNHILQHYAIDETAAMDLYCRIAESRVVKQGMEFDITTEVDVEGSRAWESVSTYLIRGKYGEPQEPPEWTRLPGLPDGDLVAEWPVPKGMGKRYAKITGDYNPIHVSKLLAKIFGFRRDIIHGMWSAAKCLTALPPLAADHPLRFDAAFKGPVFMESTVSLKAQSGEDRHRFDLFCGGNPRPVLQGLLRRGEAGEQLVGP